MQFGSEDFSLPMVFIEEVAARGGLPKWQAKYSDPGGKEMGVKRIFVEKRAGNDVQAQGYQRDFQQNLGVAGLEQVRVLLRYDVEGLSNEDFSLAVPAVFSEPPVDQVYLDEMPLRAGEVAFAVEYLPGQYDQRADSAAQCIELLTRSDRPSVRCAKVFILSGEISDEELGAIKRYVINPVDSREAALERPSTLKMNLKIPTEVPVVSGFTSMNDEQIAAYCRENGFAMSPSDLIFTRDYFASEGRDPSLTELRVIDTYWSDHCRHTTFLTSLTDVDFEEGPVSCRVKEIFEEYMEARKWVYGEREKPVTLMDMATIYAKQAKKQGLLKDLDESEEINACSIRQKVTTDQGVHDYLVQFKNETHNHPTEIEPFGGAATCLGGAIRDPLSGRSYVYQAMRVTGSGDPREKETMPYKLPQRKITREAAAGYSSYGNQIGLATGLVREVYHDGYKAKRMEIGAVVGAVPEKNVRREVPEQGDAIILIGGRTGRDGCGGATGSSKAHDEKSTSECGAEVQKGNPLTERKLQRLFRNPGFTLLVKRCNDFGAGGVSVAIGELADSLDVDLDKVPRKYEGLDGTELAISESQERMAVVVAKEDVAKVIECARQENLEATEVAVVTDTGRMRFTWNGKTIVDIKREFLNTNGAPQYAKALVQNAEIKGIFDEGVQGGLEEAALKLLSDPNIASQQGLCEMFDSTIGAGTVLMPFGGKNQITPNQAMAALIPVLGERSQDATLMSYGLDPYLLEKSPFHGAVYSIVSAVAKLAASGGDYRKAWLTLQEYFRRMTGESEIWGEPTAALMGAYYAQKNLGIAAIGGKDSMSGSFMEIHVPPTVCSFAICTSPVDHIVSGEFKQAGDRLYLLDIDVDELSLPVFDDVKKKYAVLAELCAQGKIAAGYAVERGGILAAAIKMAMGNDIGVRFEDGLSIDQLVRKKYGAIVVESSEALPEIFQPIGRLTQEAEISLNGQSISIESCKQAYIKPLEKVFPTRAEAKEMKHWEMYTQRSSAAPKLKTAKPRVVIPVFPGTNCEYDTAAYFDRAGAQSEIVMIRNLTPSAIAQSTQRLIEQIRNAQIIMIPGGFSGGDEPDGSGKFIATTFRNPGVADAVMDLLQKRDGLILGICNGFQALIKLGLVPYGEIRPMREDSPTLTFNTIGRHVSRLVNTRVTSVKSPWLALTQPGDVHTIAVSHGEGRFICGEEELQALFENGQVATQYCGLDGQPDMDISINPNGSLCAVEGLLSPDGRVFGKMAHTERYTPGVYQNVPGNKEQHLAEAGVLYFK